MDLLPPVNDPALLVGAETLDDAAIYRLSDDLALVQTVDFFTPVVDDPYDFGRIAAANAFSDVYAMGGRPLTALNIVCFPSGVLPLDYLARILQGGAEIARQAGAIIVGGHTIDDPEPKYGLAVTGVVRPGEQLTNAGAVAGDLLVLTKPLGTGIIATAIKQEKASVEAIAAATASMTTLNADGAEVARAHGVHALTDVTGFGLLGHLTEMCRAARVAAEVWFDRLSLLPQTAELAQGGVVPGGTRRNLEFIGDWTRFDPALEPWQQLVCADAQTSGGLLLSVRASEAERVVEELVARHLAAAAIIGRVVQGGEVLLEVRRSGEASSRS
jgi:selenide,water dikinase